MLRPTVDSLCPSLYKFDSFAEVRPAPPRNTVLRLLDDRQGPWPARPSRATASRRVRIASTLAWRAPEDVGAATGAAWDSANQSFTMMKRSACARARLDHVDA